MGISATVVTNQIKHDINGNLAIHDKSHIGIDIKVTGFLFWKKTEIHVARPVDSERKKNEVDKILDARANGYAIVNKLRVEKR